MKRELMNIHIRTLLLVIMITGNTPAQSPWILQNSQVSGDSKVIFSIIVTSQTDVWAAVMDYNQIPQFCEFARTIDGGSHWTSGTVNQISNHTISSFAAINRDTAWAALVKKSGVTGDIYRTYDGGETWARTDTTVFKGSTSSPDNLYFFDKSNGVCFGDPVNGYFEIYTTNNGGTRWTRVPSGNIPAPLTAEVCINEKFCAVNNTIWVGTTRGRVFRSKDRGLTWTASTAFSTTIQIGALAFKDTLNGLVIGSGTKNAKKTADGGNTWNIFTIESGNYSSSFGKSLIYVKGVGSIPGFYLCGGRSGTSHFASYSSDDGVRWEILDTLYHSCFGFYDVNTGWTCASGSTTTRPDIYKFIQISSGVSPPPEDSEIEIYPNPGNGIFNFRSDEENLRIEIFDVMGRSIYSEGIGSDEHRIDMTRQPKGVYIYKLFKDQKLLKSGKLFID